MDSSESTEYAEDSIYQKIDHIAFAVRDLESALVFFTDQLGFELNRRLTITGKKSGMISAELSHGGIKFVLCQGTGSSSQISRLIQNYGPGVAHIALAVEDVQKTSVDLQRAGVAFDTKVIEGPGLKQSFTRRDPNTGLSFEFIERTSEQGFLEENVKKLFQQLEDADAY